ncbi:MAG: condensation domain-containing protein, partial [Psychrosphaera sp.]|nr:condensation domain-containing protein [Psychrosphaera sp.]
SGDVEQTLAAPAPLDVPYVDLSGEDYPYEAALSWNQSHFDQRFSFDDKPLVRYTLVKEAEDCFGFMGVYHHLITDGMGVSMVHKQIGEIYTALVNGQSVDVESYPCYFDFVENDRDYLASKRFTNHRQYWLDKYQVLPEPLFTPIENAAGDGQLAQSHRKVLSLPRPLFDQLTSTAQDCQATTFHILLAALYVYFTRTAQVDEMAIGLPVLNRPSSAFKQTVGLFVGVSAARFSFGKDLPFDQLMREIGFELKRNYRFQRLPMSALNRELMAKKTTDNNHRQRLFDVGLSYEQHDHRSYFDGAPSRSKPMLHSFEQLPLMIHVRNFDQDADVDVDFIYNSAYFTEEHVQRIQAGFSRILDEVLVDPKQSVSSIDLLGYDDVAKLQQWNQTQADFPAQLGVATVFERQVAKTPDNTALVYGPPDEPGQQLSYRQLNEQANQLAHHLIEAGVGPDVLVGICVERCCEMMVAILAVFKAGGAYVPMDPDYPASRLQYLLEDSGVSLLLSQSRVLSQTQVLDKLTKSQAKIVDLTLFFNDEVQKYSRANPTAQSGPNDLAYVIYTSGSTGNPKGVMIAQASVV